MSLTELSLNIPTDHVANVFGQFDAYIKKIERTLNVTVVLRGESMSTLERNIIKKSGTGIFTADRIIKRGNIITEQNVNYALALSEEEKNPQSWRSIRTVSAIRSTASRSNQRHLDRKHMWMRYARK